MTKEEILLRQQKLLDMTGDFCSKKLNPEYAQLCDKLIRKLGRKRDVPFQAGKPEIWAAAVIYALGQINFLFDKSAKPYIPQDQICDYFGTRMSTVSNKAREIRDMLKIGPFSPEFSTEAIMKNNPFKDMVMINGLIVPKKLLSED